LLVVSGSVGKGKSTLMAYAAYKIAMDNKCKVAFHFVGGTPNSTAVPQVIRRLWYECADIADDEIPTDLDGLMFSLEAVFRRASDKVKHDGQSRLVVFIDAIDQLNNDNDVLGLQWLPKEVPFNVRVIVSTLEDSTFDVLKCCGVQLLSISELDYSTRKDLVNNYFSMYGKKLSEKQLSSLLQHKDATCPLWLSHACEEMRLFGVFEKVDETIQGLEPSLDGIVKQIVRRIISESTVGGDLTQAAFSLIGCSQFGLTELEMRELLAVEPTLPSESKLIVSCARSQFDFIRISEDDKKLPMHTVSKYKYSRRLNICC
jgi:nephrocystin-3